MSWELGGLGEETNTPRGGKECSVGTVGAQTLPRTAENPRPFEGLLRGSRKVKLVAALDVVHQVSSIEKFHHKKEVFLGEKQRQSQFLASSKKKKKEHKRYFLNGY